MDIRQQTLSHIVKANHQTVGVLEKYDLDFCCKGKRTLEEACIEKKLSSEDIANELLQFFNNKEAVSDNFESMSIQQLVAHILLKHHSYVKQIMPQISYHVQKVAVKHGDRFPYMREVFTLFEELRYDMTDHMQKEELILFPRLKEVEKMYNSDEKTTLPAGFIDGPVHVMESEHERAGEIMYQIRSLTNNYTLPEGGCMTFSIALQELKEFEQDLHQHVHLENNILFPSATDKIKKLTSL